MTFNSELFLFKDVISNTSIKAIYKSGILLTLSKPKLMQQTFCFMKREGLGQVCELYHNFDLSTYESSSYENYLDELSKTEDRIDENRVTVFSYKYQITIIIIKNVIPLQIINKKDIVKIIFPTIQDIRPLTRVKLSIFFIIIITIPILQGAT